MMFDIAAAKKRCKRLLEGFLSGWKAQFALGHVGDELARILRGKGDE